MFTYVIVDLSLKSNCHGNSVSLHSNKKYDHVVDVIQNCTWWKTLVRRHVFELKKTMTWKLIFVVNSSTNQIKNKGVFKYYVCALGEMGGGMSKNAAAGKEVCAEMLTMIREAILTHIRYFPQESFQFPKKYWPKP